LPGAPPLMRLGCEERSGRRGLLRSGTVLLGDGVQAIGPVHRALRVGPAIELAPARSGWPSRGGFLRGRWRRRRRIRDPDPRVRHRYPIAAQLVPPGRKLHDVRRRRRRDRDRWAPRWSIAHGRAIADGCAIARGWFVVGRQSVVHGGRRIADSRRSRHDSEREERPRKRPSERARHERLVGEWHRHRSTGAQGGAPDYRASIVKSLPLVAAEGGARRDQLTHRQGQRSCHGHRGHRHRQYLSHLLETHRVCAGA
jgi:hypothetical protein